MSDFFPIALLGFVLVGGCGGSDGSDPGDDGGGGGLDAGTVDAGDVDSGTDGGRLDAGTDGGRLDAGTDGGGARHREGIWVVSGGASEAISRSFRLRIGVGAPQPIGTASSPSYRLVVGPVEGP